MTTALDRARALLDTPPPAPVPGQLDLKGHTVSSYTEPADRPDAWAAMAADLAAAGRTTTEIAAALWIDEPTVINLLLPTGGAA